VAFVHNPEAQLPLGPRFHEGFVTTLQVSLHATDRPFARPPRMRTLSFCFDAGISPHAENQVPGTLASPQTGLTPAGRPELLVRLHYRLLSYGARTAERTAYAELGGAPATMLLTCTDVTYHLVLKEFYISLLVSGNVGFAQNCTKLRSPIGVSPRLGRVRCSYKFPLPA
jgi:hypothetical protein